MLEMLFNKFGGSMSATSLQWIAYFILVAIIWVVAAGAYSGSI